MALLKQIKQPNGITLGYHRIYGITSNPTDQTSISVTSYVDADGRKAEKEWLASDDHSQPMDVYMSTKLYDLDYRDGMTLADAYAYLLTLPAFSGATDAGTAE